MSDTGVPQPASFRHGPFQGLVGYDIVDDENGLYFTLTIRRDLLNPHGVLHGGVALTMLDAVGGRCLVGRDRRGTGEMIRSSVTVTLTTDFMRAVGEGTLYAIGTPDHIGKTLAHVSMELRHGAIDGLLVARGVGTYRVYTKSLAKAG